MEKVIYGINIYSVNAVLNFEGKRRMTLTHQRIAIELTHLL